MSYNIKIRYLTTRFELQLGSNVISVKSLNDLLRTHLNQKLSFSDIWINDNETHLGWLLSPEHILVINNDGSIDYLTGDWVYRNALPVMESYHLKLPSLHLV